VRRALADPAVGDDRVAVEDAVVELAQLVGGPERAVVADRLRPRHRLRARDVAGALGALVLVAGHRDQLAGELLRRADVDQLRRPAERRDHLVPVRADRLVRVVGGEHARRVIDDDLRRRAALGDPLLARAVEQLHGVVAVVLQVPVRVGGEPVVAVAVEDDRVGVRDAARAEQRAERLRVEEIAPDLVLQVAHPVEADRPRDVGLGVERRVLVDLDHAQVGVTEMLLEPARLDEHVLGVGHTHLLIGFQAPSAAVPGGTLRKPCDGNRVGA
jgi:hypothetical protein